MPYTCDEARKKSNQCKHVVEGSKCWTTTRHPMGAKLNFTNPHTHIAQTCKHLREIISTFGNKLGERPVELLYKPRSECSISIFYCSCLMGGRYYLKCWNVFIIKISSSVITDLIKINFWAAPQVYSLSRSKGQNLVSENRDPKTLSYTEK